LKIGGELSGANCPRGELFWGELSKGRVVQIPVGSCSLERTLPTLNQALVFPLLSLGHLRSRFPCSLRYRVSNESAAPTTCFEFRGDCEYFAVEWFS